MRRLLLGLCLAVAPLGSASAVKPCPPVMLVIDQSASMAQDVDGNEPGSPAFHGESKWEMTKGVVDFVVNRHGEQAAFGLELFSTDAWNDAGKCEAAAMITVPLSHSSSGEIIAQMKAAQPQSQTNTGEAIKRATEDPGMHPYKNPGIIILITDGEPNCNPIDRRASQDPTAVPQYTIDQIAAAKAAGNKTYVVGFDGNGIRPLTLDNMAYYGGTARQPNCGTMGNPPDYCYYRAGGSEQEFKDTLETIFKDPTFELGECGDTCLVLGCPSGQVCVTDETSPDPHCVNDPCGGKSCGGDTFCRGGACVQSCQDGCPQNTLCQDGKCVQDKCAGNGCGAGQACNPADGSCVDFPCAICNPGSFCDVTAKKCLADQCRIITCPQGMKCVNNGNCQAPLGGVGTCHATGRAPTRGDTLGLIALAAALASLAMLVLRRRRPAA